MIKIPKQLFGQKFIKTKEKIPQEQDWCNKKNYRVDDIDFKRYLEKARTYGVLCGINNLLVIDLDNKEIQDDIISKYDIFKKTFIVKTAGKGLYHFYFYTDKEPESFKCLDKDLNTLFDAQGKGKQVIGAGSCLSNGKYYEVFNDAPILEVKYSVLKGILDLYGQNNQDDKKKPERAGNELQDPIVSDIKSKIRVADILRGAGINTKKNPTECPFHSSKGGKCLSFTDLLWHCFHCNKSGDIFSLYMELNKCSFFVAKQSLMKKAGIDKKILQEKKEEKESEKQKKYLSLDIKKYVIYKSKDETIYKIYIGDFNITLTPDTILTSSDFRKKYFNETGDLLKGISNDHWVELVNQWVEEKGQIIDHTDETNTNNLIVETILGDIQSFGVVKEPIEAISYGRVLYLNDEPNYVYICNKVLDSILKKNQFKINMSKLKVLLDEYIDGKSKVIRTGKRLNRFFRFKLEMLDIDLGDLKDENN